MTVLRLGRMSESSLQQGWDPQWREGFYAQVRRSGMEADSGEPVDPADVADTLAHILTLPQTIAPDLFVLRARPQGDAP